MKKSLFLNGKVFENENGIIHLMGITGCVWRRAECNQGGINEK